MQSLFSEKRLAIPQAATRAGVAEGTAWRWVLKGVGPHKVRLESYVVGRRRYTSDKALRRFFERCTSVADADLISPPKAKRVTPANRKREIERADRESAKHGVV